MMHAFLWFLAAACNNDAPDPLKEGAVDTGTGAVDTGPGDSGDPGLVDADGDGVDTRYDCDDSDPDTYPGAWDRCDGKDNDCDKAVDEDVLETWYADGDGDGQGDPEAPVETCDPGKGLVDNDTDCDDTSSAVRQGAAEVCDNSVDDDCDDDIDEGCIPSGALDTDLAQTTYASGITGDLFGYTAVAVPDWDGDGVPDVAISAFAADSASSSSGVLYLFSGADSGTLGIADTIGAAYGDSPYASIGQTLSVGSDLDGDSSPELLVSLSGRTDRYNVSPYTGAVDIVTGLDRGSLVVAARWSGEESYARLGTGAATADLDGDGGAELIMGAPYAGYLGGTATGEIFIINDDDVTTGGAASDGVSVTSTQADRLGEYISQGGDVDGDGHDEVIIVGEGAWLVSGVPGSALIEDWAVASFSATGRADLSGDLNGDGYNDIVLSDPLAGEVYIFDGTVSGEVRAGRAWLRLAGDGRDSYPGSALSITSDHDGDGLEDLLVGEKWAGGLAGRLCVIAGVPTGVMDLGDAWSVLSPTTTSQLGVSADGSADFSGDGVSDILVGSLPTTYGVSTVFRWAPGD